MEYFLGSLITLIIMSYFGKRSAKIVAYKPKPVMYSQSYIDKLISEMVFEKFIPPLKKDTQSSKYMDGGQVRVIIIDGEAYWIVDQTLYVAKMVDGIVDTETTKKVDTMTMNNVQLEKTQFIVQKLTEGKGNDSGYPRKP
jgi:hypothetical protein